MQPWWSAAKGHGFGDHRYPGFDPEGRLLPLGPVSVCPTCLLEPSGDPSPWVVSGDPQPSLTHMSSGGQTC